MKVLTFVFLVIFANICVAETTNIHQRKRINVINAAKNIMDYTMERQKILAENISSQDVPGYHAKDLQTLDVGNKINVNRVALQTTSAMHISSRSSSRQTSYRILKEPFNTSTTRMNNNVDIPSQMVKVTENMNKHNLATTIHKEMHNLVKIALGQ